MFVLFRLRFVHLLLTLWVSMLFSVASAQKLPEEYRNRTYETLNGGVRLEVINQGTGPAVNEGHRVYLKLTGKLWDNTVFYDNFDAGRPLQAIIGTQQLIPGMEEALYRLNGGAEAYLIIPPEKAYGDRGAGDRIPPGATLFFHLKIDSVTFRPVAIIPFNTAGKDTLTTRSGLRYIIVTPGSGAPPAKHATVTVHYTLYLASGNKIIDSSRLKGKPFTFDIGDPGLIRGWNEGVALMSPGEKARFLIPWKLGYGKKGLSPSIPPKADLIFDIELIRVVTKK